MLMELEKTMGMLPGTTICGLADGASWATRTFINKFYDEFCRQVPGCARNPANHAEARQPECAGAHGKQHKKLESRRCHRRRGGLILIHFVQVRAFTEPSLAGDSRLAQKANSCSRLNHRLFQIAYCAFIGDMRDRICVGGSQLYLRFRPSIPDGRSRVPHQGQPSALL